MTELPNLTGTQKRFEKYLGRVLDESSPSSNGAKRSFLARFRFPLSGRMPDPLLLSRWQKYF